MKNSLLVERPNTEKLKTAISEHYFAYEVKNTFVEGSFPIFSTSYIQNAVPRGVLASLYFGLFEGWTWRVFQEYFRIQIVLKWLFNCFTKNGLFSRVFLKKGVRRDGGGLCHNRGWIVSFIIKAFYIIKIPSCDLLVRRFILQFQCIYMGACLWLDGKWCY